MPEIIHLLDESEKGLFHALEVDGLRSDFRPYNTILRVGEYAAISDYISIPLPEVFHINKVEFSRKFAERVISKKGTAISKIETLARRMDKEELEELVKLLNKSLEE